MLNYRNTVILFIIVLTGLILADVFLPVHALWYVGIGIVLLLVLTAGSLYIRLGFYIKTFCAGDRSQKMVAFSFDDGPDAQNTPLILDLLQEHEIQAAFFVVGNKLANNMEIIRRIDQEGHILG